MVDPTGRTSQTVRNGTDPAARGRYRPELEGLRAVAVVLVVLYHVWFGRVSGGVDVFFLISGFLVTGGLYRAALRDRVRLVATWSRQLSRLLPAIVVVLLASTVAAALLLPPTRWLPTIREIVASALFLQNWELADAAVDYAARNDAASVVQHFWSLAVQGQFYLVWPVLVAVVALLARRVPGASLHRTLTLALAAVGGASLVFSVVLTASNQPLAYFHSLTRVWEFALGGLLALWIDRVADRPGGRTRLVMGWTGIAALVSCGVLLTVDRAFPGIAALWPTTAAALVLLAGRTGHRWGADRFLTTPVAVWLGALAFPLYLWHWPILVLTLVVSGTEQLGLLAGTAVIAVSVVLAEVTRRVVENPLRDAGTRTALRFSAAGLAVVLVLCAGWQVVATSGSEPEPSADAAAVSHPGAAALDPAWATDVVAVDAASADVPLLPSLLQAGDDWSYRNGTWLCGPSERRPDLEVCTIPPPSGAAPQRRIAVVGDSHAQQYTAALMPIAAQRDWELTVMFRGACPFSVDSEVDPADEGCVAWNREAADEVVEQRPDALLTLASRDVRATPEGPAEQTPPGFVGQWWRAHDAGIPVVAVRDNPRPGFSVPECVSREGRHAPACDVPRDAVYPSLPSWTSVPDVPPNVGFLDVADQVCDVAVCPSEVGNVLVYLDDNHLTATYAATLAPVLARHLESTLGW